MCDKGNDKQMTSKVDIRVADFISFENILKSGIARSCGNSIFNFNSNSILKVNPFPKVHLWYLFSSLYLNS